MAGTPTRPDAGPQAPSDLAAHSLASGPAPIANPLKGFVSYALTKSDDEDLRKFPYSMEFRYFAFSDLMKDWNHFDWTPMEDFLNQTAADGKQALIRVYFEYPDEKSGIPDFLRKAGVKMRRNEQWKTDSPDYDDPLTIKAISQLVHAWGAKYDGDPRIGFITLGIVGLWGEWHTYPAENLMPKDENAAAVIRAYADAFKKTQLLVRYPYAGGGAALGLPIGYHDDSFAFKDEDKGQRKGVTLPQSEGGWDWSFLQSMLNGGAENRWTSCAIGGELRPEIQTSLFKDRSNVDDLETSIALSHVTWLLNQKGVEGFPSTDAEMQSFSSRLGYEFRIDKAYFAAQQESGKLRVGLRILNEGVAPFYYPWTLQLGLKDSSGKLLQTWDTDWDLRLVQPLKIRAYKDWKLAGSSMDFGYPRYFEFSSEGLQVPAGTYALVFRVKNPLPSTKALPLLFANTGQDTAGWLQLGTTRIP
jgi:hypothetical protein